MEIRRSTRSTSDSSPHPSDTPAGRAATEVTRAAPSANVSAAFDIARKRGILSNSVSAALSLFSNLRQGVVFHAVC
jgi:hypothetical protein